MPDPAYIQLPADAPDNKNKVRSFSLVDDEGYTVLEQVEVIGDADGNIVGIRQGARYGSALRVASGPTEELLEEILSQLVTLTGLLASTLRPKDDVAKHLMG